MVLQENYVTFEQAKKLQEKGFPYRGISNFDKYTLSLVQKWLREEKKIYISIECDTDYPEWTGDIEFIYDITFCKDNLTTSYRCDRFKTYEDALSKGIDKALEMI